jgi:hypothetical protein
MSETQGIAITEVVNEAPRVQAPEQTAHPRAVGSPLPMGSRSPSSPVAAKSEPLRGNNPPFPGRGLANPSTAAPLDVPSGVQRAVSAIRAALPFVQRILPLLDGNIGTAVSNLLAPHHRLPPPPPPPPPVNLAPIQEGLAELQTQQRELRNQVVEQNSSLKRVEDRLEMVREATDRNTLEQQELLEDLKGVGNKLNLFALIAMGLLALSVLLNIVLYLHILRVLP